MLWRWWGEQSSATPWFPAGAVFCVLRALLADGPDAREVARACDDHDGFVVLLLAFRNRRRSGLR